jgi:CDP-diacylglycerol--glycerol-3-phosphate 3-phosphatidyltransferase
MRPAPPDHLGDPVQGASNWNIANALTVARLLTVPVFAWLLVSSKTDPSLRTPSAVLFLVAAATDLVDGEVARRRGLVTSFGKIADPIADKALTGTALVGLSWLGAIPWWVTGVIVAREAAVTALRFWVIEHGVIPASRGGKLKTLLQVVTITAYLLPLTGGWATAREWLLGVTVVVTVVTGLDYASRALRLRRAAAAAG